MEDAFGRVTAFIVCAVLMFVIPFKYCADRMDYMRQIYITERTVEFVDSVRNTGVITANMLETYKRQIGSLDGRRQIRMSHIVRGKNDGALVETEYCLEDIENGICGKDGKYLFRADEYFRVRITGRGASGVFENICIYGGYVRNETY